MINYRMIVRKLFYLTALELGAPLSSFLEEVLYGNAYAADDDYETRRERKRGETKTRKERGKRETDRRIKNQKHIETEERQKERRRGRERERERERERRRARQKDRDTCSPIFK